MIWEENIPTRNQDRTEVRHENACGGSFPQSLHHGGGVRRICSKRNTLLAVGPKPCDAGRDPAAVRIAGADWIQRKGRSRLGLSGAAGRSRKPVDVDRLVVR